MKIVDQVRGELEAWSKWSADELRARQDARLAAILRHHFNNPHNSAYRELLQAEGIEGEQDLPRSVEELGRLPKISRTFYERARYSERPAVSAELVGKNIETSGSTGAALTLPHTVESARQCYGVSLMRAAVLCGADPLAPSYFVGHWIPGGKDVWTSHEAMLAFQSLVGDRALIESTHAKMPEHLAHLATHRARWGASTPTFFLALASYAAEAGVDLRQGPFKTLLLGGGTCLPENRRILQDAYAAEAVKLIYATSESFLSAAELRGEEGYLCFEDDYILEVVDASGQPVKPGQRGEILITCLGNRGYPGIRYRQGDSVLFLGKSSGFPAFSKIDRPERIDGGEIGKSRLLYSEIEQIQRHLLEHGVPSSAVQLARRRRGVLDLPIFRIETTLTDRSKVESAVLQAFRRNPTMDYMLGDGSILPPHVELYPPGGLTLGKAKVAPYVDEQKLPAPSAGS